MKKVIIAVVALISFTTMKGQEDKARFGAKAGLNIANLVGDGTNGVALDAKISFHIGGLVEIPVSEKFAIQPELVYSSQGASTDVDTGFGVAEATINFNYLNLPVIAKYYVAEGFSIQAGPQVGFLVASNVTAEFGGESQTEDVEDVNSFDLGLALGFGYQLESNLFFDARYYLGLSNTDDSEFSDSDFPTKNSVFQISVGYKF